MAAKRLNAWQALFRHALAILDSAPRAGSMLREWSFGGGTVLMRRHRHRLITDIDIFLPDRQLLGHLTPRLNPAAEALTHYYVEQANFLKLYFPEGEIDFVVSGFLTAVPVTTERIDGRDIRVETSAEIIAKKVWYRGADFTARDMFDFALIAQREPWAIRHAGEILSARRSAVLERIEVHEAALREDFEALDVLDFQPSYEQCVEAIRSALEASSRPFSGTEQRVARYRVSRAAISPRIGL